MSGQSILTRIFVYTNQGRNMQKHRLKLIAVLLGTFFLAACTPAQIAWFTNDATPAQQQAVIKALQSQNQKATYSGDCYSAIDRYWPGDKGWARKIVRRESGNNPSARNPRSSAKGCFQLMHSYHAGRYKRVGCSPSQWSNAGCNVRAAWTLYQEAGKSPWYL